MQMTNATPYKRITAGQMGLGIKENNRKQNIKATEYLKKREKMAVVWVKAKA